VISFARYAAISFFDQLNSVPSIQMRCRMTASLRATATVASHSPFRALQRDRHSDQDARSTTKCVQGLVHPLRQEEFRRENSQKRDVPPSSGDCPQPFKKPAVILAYILLALTLLARL
jgi:hypothetical protein